MHFMEEPPRWCSGKNPPAEQETQVPSLGQEDLLEKEMAAHFSIFAWKIPQTEEPGMLQSLGLQRVRHDLVTEHVHMPFIDFSQLYWQRWHAIRWCQRRLGWQQMLAGCFLSAVALATTPNTHARLNQHPPSILCREIHVTVITEASAQGGSRSRKEEVWDSMASVFCHFLETWVAQAQTTTVRSNCKYSREIFRTSGHLLHCDRAQDIKWGVERRRNGKWPITQCLMDFC